MGLGGLFNTEEHSHSHYKPQYGNTRKKLHSSCGVKLKGEKLSDKMFLAKKLFRLGVKMGRKISHQH